MLLCGASSCNPVAGTDRTRAREWPRPGTSRRAEGAILDRRDFGRVHESSKIANDFFNARSRRVRFLADA